MLCEVRSLGLSGISGYEVRAECDLSAGLPAFEIVGLPDAAVKEARDRVRAAIKNCGFTFPVSRITVNLAPANQRKGGTVYDLPILAGILAAGVLKRHGLGFEGMRVAVSGSGNVAQFAIDGADQRTDQALAKVTRDNQIVTLPDSPHGLEQLVFLQRRREPGKYPENRPAAHQFRTGPIRLPLCQHDALMDFRILDAPALAGSN